MRMRFIKRLAARQTRTIGVTPVLLVMALLVIGCDAPEISGKVRTVTGDPLPGVVVEVASTGAQALTDALGEYTIAIPPVDEVSLRFAKTGYTPGQLDVPVGGGEGPLQARAVQLWNLPAVKGVFLYQDSRYVPAKPMEVEAVRVEDGMVYGTTRYRPSSAGAPPMPADRPPLICYAMPSRPPQLARLESAEVLAQDPSPHRIQVLRAVQAIPATAMTIDEPAGRLRQVRVYSDLAPGIYGIHWGALDGDFRAERRVFLLEVTGPNASGEGAEESGEDESAEQEDA